MFSELTTMKIIDAIYNLSVETYDETVDLCKDALNKNIINIESVILKSIRSTVINFKPILLPMYSKFYADITGGKKLLISSYIMPEYNVSIEIYEHDDVKEFNDFIMKNSICLKKSSLLKESIQCNAINIMKFLITNGGKFKPSFIHYCWSFAAYSILKDNYYDIIIEYLSDKSNMIKYISTGFNYLFRNKFVEHMLEIVFEDFNYDDYLELNNNVVPKYVFTILRNCCLDMDNFEFTGAVCNHSEPCLHHVLEVFVTNYGMYDILEFINDGYKKYFEYVTTFDKLDEVYVRGYLVTLYSQDVTDEYGRDLCMLLLSKHEKMMDEKYCRNSCSSILNLITLQKINLQKADINGKTLMNYIEDVSKCSTYQSAQSLLWYIQNQ